VRVSGAATFYSGKILTETFFGETLFLPFKHFFLLLNQFSGGGGATRANSAETQQSGHAPRSGPEVKNGRSRAKDGAPERLRCGTIQKEMS